MPSGADAKPSPQFTSRLILSSEVGEGFADGEASPDRLRLVLTLPGTPADEVRLHLACAEHRLRASGTTSPPSTWRRRWTPISTCSASVSTARPTLAFSS